MSGALQPDPVSPGPHFSSVPGKFWALSSGGPPPQVWLRRDAQFSLSWGRSGLSAIPKVPSWSYVSSFSSQGLVPAHAGAKFLNLLRSSVAHWVPGGLLWSQPHPKFPGGAGQWPLGF